MTNTEELIPVEEQEETLEPKEGVKPFWRKYRGAMLGAVLGIGAACLFMWLGFWKTVFILGMAAIGAFLFGVDNKMDRLKNCINKLFPSRK